MPTVEASLTTEVRRDPRLPHDGFATFRDRLLDMTPEARRAALQPFAEWQRRFDKELPWSPTYREAVDSSLRIRALSRQAGLGVNDDGN
jgi:hypothetical protein